MKTNSLIYEARFLPVILTFQLSTLVNEFPRSVGDDIEAKKKVVSLISNISAINKSPAGPITAVLITLT